MIGIYIFIIIVCFVTTLFTVSNPSFDDNGLMFFTPKYIYNKTKMNIFGCIICSLIIIIFDSIYCIIAIIIWSIWKLFHVGRKV